MRGSAGAMGGAAPLACALAIVAVFAASADAKMIQVRASQDDAINNAIDRAAPGDRLLVHKGTYAEPVLVDKRVSIVGKRRRHRRHHHHKHRHRRLPKPVIDAGCAFETGFDVTAEGVRLRRLEIRGGGEYTVDISHVAHATAEKLRLIDECGAEYGINVYRGGAVSLLRNRASGYSDAGIYVGGIIDTADGELVVSGNDSFGNNRGLIVEDSISDADIRVADNRFHDNVLPGIGTESGIFVHNSQGATFSRNVASGNGVYGIHLDANSDGNRLFDNIFTGNPVPILNQGADNCGSGNSPDMFPPC